MEFSASEGHVGFPLGTAAPVHSQGLGFGGDYMQQGSSTRRRLSGASDGRACCKYEREISAAT